MIPVLGLLLAASPVPTFPGAPSEPETLRPPVAGAERLISAPVRGLGPRLAARIRSRGPDAIQRFVARGIDLRALEALGGRVTARFGEVIAGEASGRTILAIAPSALLIEAPAPLKPLLDHSRTAIGADRTDFAQGFSKKHRGAGVIIAAYDSGADLLHPDLRTTDGKNRVIAAWDQDAQGTPPEGQSRGDVCTRERITEGSCPLRDRSGHGTHVLSIAGSSGPRYRGVAPESDLIVARSELFDDLPSALAWFRAVGAAEMKPLVVNLSLGGHEGPHDGSSLDAQAIDAFEHLVVAAAGNDGGALVHARIMLGEDPKDLGIDFPRLVERSEAIIELWADAGSEVVAQIVAIDEGQAFTISSSIARGDQGRTEPIEFRGLRLGFASLDAEAEPNAFNGKTHLRVELLLPGYDRDRDPRLAVRLTGSGALDAWIDAPATSPQPPTFAAAGALGLPTEAAPDFERALSDPATAKTALAVASFVTRTVIDREGADPIQFGGEVGALSGFTSRGPTLAPEATGPKPEIAAPGQVIVGALSRDAPEVGTTKVTPLYRAASGTSMATPHVAGAAALILEGSPKTDKAKLKRLILDSAAEAQDEDPRWGKGRLDVAAAVVMATGDEEGCGCRTARGRRSRDFAAFGIAIAWAAVRSARRRRRLKGQSPRVTREECTLGIAHKASAARVRVHRSSPSETPRPATMQSS
jgi:minor extracellular serine protease Vpr